VRVLVTGGCGYIGSHTTVELLNAGHEVIIVDNLSNSQIEVLNRIRKITGKEVVFYQIDLLDKLALAEVFMNHRIDAVIHFAGMKAVGESVMIPLAYYHCNVAGTINLCELMTENNVKRLVFSSSATVYGIPDTVPVSESSPIRATNPYGRTKIMIEEILQDLYASDNEWSISLLRYFNPVGAHESGLIGEEPKGIPNNIMPFITQVAIKKIPELRIFGNDYPTNDGTGVRDYIHVVDLAQGHLKALSKIMNTSGVNAYNLGTGRGYSVLELVKAFEKATGCSIPYRFVERRPGDVAVSYADCHKAWNEMDWAAEKGIEDMCRDAWHWQQINTNGYATAID